MTSGGKRPGAGRKPLAEDKKRRPLWVTLPLYLMQWLDSQPESNSVIIENAINNQYKIKGE